MKTYLPILAGMLSTFAHAQVYPSSPDTDQLIPRIIKDRKERAPFYAESPMPSVSPAVRELAKFVEVTRVEAGPVNSMPRCAELTLGEAAAKSIPLRRLDAHPELSSAGLVSLRTIAPSTTSAPLVRLTATPVKSLPSWTTLSVDPFMLKVEFLWKKPHGQWMNSLLKQINTARAAGDTEAYNALTARYSEWAEKYLRHESNPPADLGP